MSTTDRDARKRFRVSSHEQRRINHSVKRAGSAGDVATACQVSLTTPYRWQNGDVASPFEVAHVTVAQLSETPGTDAHPFIESLKVTALRPALSKWSVDELIKEWHRLFNLETDAEAREERAGRCSDWNEFIGAHLEEAAIQNRLVAVTEILIYDMGVDPRLYTRDGRRIIRQMVQA